MQTVGDVLGDITKQPADPESNLRWAWGCDQCKRGIVTAPELTGAVSLYAERLVHCVEGDVQFCTCRAGHMARQHMQRLWRTRQQEMQSGGAMGPFDEVAWAKQKIEAAYEMMARTPTIREQA